MAAHIFLVVEPQPMRRDNHKENGLSLSPKAINSLENFIWKCGLMNTFLLHAPVLS